MYKVFTACKFINADERTHCKSKKWAIDLPFRSQDAPQISDKIQTKGILYGSSNKKKKVPHQQDIFHLKSITKFMT